jgi:formylglycine-generating enzyme required for sulfatase activity
MGRFELTKTQWMAMMGTTPWAFDPSVSGDPDSPAVYVSWDDAQSFVSALNDYTGLAFWLPSEAQWEYACRAGTETRFYWGDDQNGESIGGYAWWDRNTSSIQERYAHVVGMLLPNAWGLYDMSGNVREWCQDWYHSNYVEAPMDGSAWEVPADQDRVTRGGSWLSRYSSLCSSYYRYHSSPRDKNNHQGFRVGLTENDGPAEGEGRLLTETVLLPGGVPLEMLGIPPGSFLMGRYPGEQDSSIKEDPQHRVTFARRFWLGRYELSKAQWKAVMGFSPWQGHSDVLDDPNSPAVLVSWEEIQDFIAALNSYTGQTFRLPSEAEWEYACRAGTTTRFYWGDDPSYVEISDYAWWTGNAWSSDQQYAHVVGMLPPNAWGLYDMSGNVSEWCEDDWREGYTGAPVDGRAWIFSPRAAARTVRGGGYYESYVRCRSASRNGFAPQFAWTGVGFRLAR